MSGGNTRKLFLPFYIFILYLYMSLDNLLFTKISYFSIKCTLEHFYTPLPHLDGHSASPKYKTRALFASPVILVSSLLPLQLPSTSVCTIPHSLQVASVQLVLTETSTPLHPREKYKPLPIVLHVSIPTRVHALPPDLVTLVGSQSLLL